MKSNLTVTVSEFSVPAWLVVLVLATTVVSGVIAFVSAFEASPNTEKPSGVNAQAVLVVVAALITVTGVVSMGFLAHEKSEDKEARVAALQAAAAEQLGGGFLNLDYSTVSGAFDNDPSIGSSSLRGGMLIGDTLYKTCEITAVNVHDLTYDFLVSCSTTGEDGSFTALPSKG